MVLGIGKKVKIQSRVADIQGLDDSERRVTSKYGKFYTLQGSPHFYREEEMTLVEGWVDLFIKFIKLFFFIDCFLFLQSWGKVREYNGFFLFEKDIKYSFIKHTKHFFEELKENSIDFFEAVSEFDVIGMIEFFAYFILTAFQLWCISLAATVLLYMYYPVLTILEIAIYVLVYILIIVGHTESFWVSLTARIFSLFFWNGVKEKQGNRANPS